MTTLEAWEPAGRTFDAVIASQSWHWVDPVAGAVEAAQVLRPDRRLAIFGQVFEPPIEVAEPFVAAYRRVLPDSPFSNLPARRPLDMDQTGGREVRRQDPRDGTVQRPRTVAIRLGAVLHARPMAGPAPHPDGLTELPPDKTADILNAVGTAIDTLGGHFTMQYATLATTAVRTGSAPRNGG